MRRFPIQLRPLLGVGAAAILGGCSAFDDHRAVLSQLHAVGNYGAAAELLDDPKMQRLYGGEDALLWRLDRGAVALALDRPDEAVELLEDAERQIEVTRGSTAGDVLARWALNDRNARYIPEPYEDIYVNVLKLLAQLEAGRISGGATVEARRLAGKADMLRDQYIKYREALEEESSPRLGGARSAGGLIEVNEEGEFLESPLGTYLSAVTFMENGDRELQAVAARRLGSSLALQAGLIGTVRAEDFEGLGALDPDDANVLVVALSGRGPTKYPERVGPIPLGTLPVYFELPELQTHPSAASGARLEVEGGGGAVAALVEDLSAVATENHRRMLPLIYQRTLLRYAVKAGISLAVTEGLRAGASDQDQGWVQLAGVLGGLAALAATERADLRSWVFLPGQARVALVKLPPGQHRVRVVYESWGGGAAYSTPWQTVNVPERGLATIVTHYWG